MTAIEWTDATWNPVTGCDRVSPGCAHCYALDLAARLKAMGQPRYQRDGDPKTSGPGFGVTLHPDKLDEPLRWRKPRRVFVNSMSDLFHEEIPDSYIRRVFTVMAQARQHTFQVLTKRPERMRHHMRWHGGPSPNIWLGVSIENRRFVGRADLLRETPAAVRFISAEPLLGPLAPALYRARITSGDYSGRTGIYDGRCDVTGAHRVCMDGEPVNDSMYPPVQCDTVELLWPDGYEGAPLDLTDIDWLIVGGESGREHRPMRAEWARDLRDAAAESGAAFFFKQWGGRTPKAGGRELDGRTWDEYPAREAVAA